MISISDVTYRYPGSKVTALQGVDLTIQQGVLFGLLGPNGAGKTTLISLLTGLRRADHGMIAYAGNNIESNLSEIQKTVAWVPQEYAFYPTMTVRQNLSFFARVLKLSGREFSEKIDEVANITGLDDTFDKSVAQFSGGMKRRLNIAIGLLGSPKTLFLDEPTVGIDPQSRHFILEFIRSLNEKGTTVIYSSHYMEEVESLCSQIAILDRGKVLAQGTLSELLSGDDFGDSSAVRICLREALADAAAVLAPFVLSADRRTLVSERMDNTLLIKQLQALDSCAAEVASLQYGTGTLEDLFLNLTDRSLPFLSCK